MFLALVLSMLPLPGLGVVPAHPPEVTARHTRFGMEGQAWEITLGPAGRLWLKRPLAGDQLSSIRTLDPEVSRGLEAALRESRFCGLDEQYGRVVMDGPE